MKKTLVTFLFSALSLVPSAFAAPSAADADHPCKKIQAACEAAGYLKGGHKKGEHAGKGLFMDCMKPILAGQTVAGVTVDAPTLEACKEKKEKRQAKKAAAASASMTPAK